MINKNNVMWLDMMDGVDYERLEVVLSDNGDWEYGRFGLGMFEGMVFIVDMNDGDGYSVMNFVREGMGIEDVLKKGMEVGVFVKEGKEVFYNWEMDGNEGKWKEFCDSVGCDWKNDYWSEVE